MVHSSASHCNNIPGNLDDTILTGSVQDMRAMVDVDNLEKELGGVLGVSHVCCLVCILSDPQETQEENKEVFNFRKWLKKERLARRKQEEEGIVPCTPKSVVSWPDAELNLKKAIEHKHESAILAV